METYYVLMISVFQLRHDKHHILSLAQHMYDAHQVALPKFVTAGVEMCGECTWWSLDGRAMKQHARIHEDTDIKAGLDKYACPLCDLEAEDWFQLREHYKQVHNLQYSLKWPIWGRTNVNS